VEKIQLQYEEKGEWCLERNKTCCCTGHRPDRLPWGDNEADPRCVQLKERLQQALKLAYADGICHFICGMARGSDLYFAEAVLALRERQPDVTLECACPYEGQAAHWPEPDRRRHEQILNQCDYETLVQHQYDRGCMMRRNRYMVDHSSCIIAVYDGTPKGGTAQTLAYALKHGLRTDILWVEEEPSE